MQGWTLPAPIHTGDVSSVPFPPPEAVTDTEARLKYIDDLSLAESIRLDTNLCLSLDQGGPKTFHDRNGLCLPPGNTSLQRRLDDLVTYVEDHDMVLNTKKTKIIPFNFSRKFDFVPEFMLQGEEPEVVYLTKLLGVMCSSDCKWAQNTAYIVRKASSKLWFLRRLKTLGVSKESLVDIYKLFVRSNLEFAVPLWAGAITKKEIGNIERVQKIAAAIILGSRYTDYNEALEILDLELLSDRRTTLTLKFAKNLRKDERFSHLFPDGVSTRSGKRFIAVPECETKRYKTSAIPFMIDLLNSD